MNIRGYWLYESVILLILGLSECKGKKKNNRWERERWLICASKVGITHRSSEGDLWEDMSKSSRAHRSSCHLVSALQRKERPLLHEERLVDQQLGDLEEILDSIGTWNWRSVTYRLVASADADGPTCVLRWGQSFDKDIKLYNQHPHLRRKINDLGGWSYA